MFGLALRINARRVWDLHFQEEVCRNDGGTDWDYIKTMMNSEVIGYRIDWLKKVNLFG